MILRIGMSCTSTSNIDCSSVSGSIPCDIVRFPCGSMSTHRTRWPVSANAAARFRVVVVLATPPFWLAKAMTLARVVTACSSHWSRGTPSGTTVRPGFWESCMGHPTSMRLIGCSLVAVAVAGCGAEAKPASNTPQAQVERTVVQVHDAVRSRSAARVCALYSADAKRDMRDDYGSTCEETLKVALDGVPLSVLSRP